MEPRARTTKPQICLIVARYTPGSVVVCVRRSYLCRAPLSGKDPAVLRISVVPLRRVLPMVSAHPGLVARRVVSGRLRLVRAGGGLYLSQEDYLSLWQRAAAAATGIRPNRLKSRTRRPPAHPPSPFTTRACPAACGWASPDFSTGYGVGAAADSSLVVGRSPARWQRIS